MKHKIIIAIFSLLGSAPLLSHAQSAKDIVDLKCSTGSARENYQCTNSERQLLDKRLSDIVKNIQDHYSYIKITEHQAKWRSYVDAWCEEVVTLAHWDGGTQTEFCLIKHIESRIQEINEYMCGENGCPQPDR